MATRSDAYAVMRSRAYVRLLVLAALLGVPIAAAAYWYLELVSAGQTWLYSDLPEALGYQDAPTWWPLPTLGIGGLIVGLALTYLPGHGGHSPADGLAVGGGPARPVDLPGIAVASLVGLAFGVVLGPEAPLIALGGGLAYLAASRIRHGLDEQTGAVVGATGSFAAVSTLLGSPLAGAFLLMEATGVGGSLATLVLVPGLLAAGIGTLIFLGLNGITGYGVFSLAIPDVPPFTHLRVSEFLWAVAVGLAAAPICWVITRTARGLRVHVDRRPLLATPLMGLAIAGIAIGYERGTDHGVEDVLFSGQTALPGLVTDSADYTAGALVLLMVCKALAYVCALSSFRGGPVFPAMFVGAAGGAALSHLPGLTLVPAVAIGIGAMSAGMLKLPLTSVLLTAIFLGTDGVTVTPLVIVASVVSYVTTIHLMPAPAPEAASTAAG